MILGEWGVSYERGTPVCTPTEAVREQLRREDLGVRGSGFTFRVRISGLGSRAEIMAYLLKLEESLPPPPWTTREVRVAVFGFHVSVFAFRVQDFGFLAPASGF